MASGECLILAGRDYAGCNQQGPWDVPDGMDYTFAKMDTYYIIISLYIYLYIIYIYVSTEEI